VFSNEKTGLNINLQSFFLTVISLNYYFDKFRKNSEIRIDNLASTISMNRSLIRLDYHPETREDFPYRISRVFVSKQTVKSNSDPNED
jgi:hypothetical protein